MVSTLFFTTTFLVLCTLSTATQPGLMLTLVNKCPFTVWPAIHPDLGHAAPQGHRLLNTKTSVSVPAPTLHRSGWIWARTGCTSAHKRFFCTTGDCGGRFHCGSTATFTPVTLTQLTIHKHNFSGLNNVSSYGVSLLHGFNVPTTVIPLGSKGKCPTVEYTL